MAITVVSKGASNSTSNTSAYTATITAPTTNRPQLAFIANSKASAADAPSSVVSTGLTWTKIADVSFGPIATGLRRLTAWRAAGTSSATSVTINFPANQTGCAWSFVEITGGDETGIGGANLIADSAILNQDGGTGLPLNLGGIVFAGDAVIAAFGLDTINAVTALEGFNQIATQTWSTPAGRIATQYHLTYDTTPTASWTASNSGGIALELKLAANAFKSNPKPGETVALTDTVTNIQLISAPVVIPLQSDTVGLTDAATAQRFETRWLGTMNLLAMPQTAETITLTDTLTNITVSVAANALAINVPDQVTLSESPTVKGLVLPILTADLITGTDNPPVVLLSSVSTLAINVPESITLTDVATPNLLHVPRVAETLTLTDTRTVQTLDMPQVADSSTLTDTRTVNLLANPQVAETVTLTEGITVTGLTLKIPAADTITLLDARTVIVVGTIPLENFDDNTQNVALWELASSWTAVDALVTVSETGHQLRITPRSNGPEANAYNGYRSVSSYNLTNAEVFVEVPQVAGVGTTADTIFTISVDAANSYSITYEGTLLYFQDRVGGIQNAATVTYNASTHRWWRIRHVSAGNTIRFDTSPNGTVWAEQRNIGAVLAVTGMKIGLEAGTYTAVGTPGVAIFDNVNTSTLTIFPTDSLTLTDTRTVNAVCKIQVTDSLTLTDTATATFLKAATLQDNFDDNNRDTTLWTVQATDDPAMTDAAVTVSETSQRLQITPMTSAGNHYNGYRSVKVYDLTGSSTHVQVVQVNDPTTSAEASLVAALDSTHWYRIIENGGILFFQDKVGVTISQATVAYNSTMHRWWRIRHDTSDNTIRFETSASGSSWTPQHSIPTVFDITALRLGIEAGTYELTGASVPAIFDSFGIAGAASLLAINEADLLTLTDVADVGLISLMADSVAVTDGALVQLWMSRWYGTVNLLEMPHIAESVTLTETRTVIQGAAGGLLPQVQESVTLTDTAVVMGLTVPISAADALTSSETLTVNLELDPQVSDSLTLTDTLIMTGLTLPLSVADSVVVSETRTVTMSVVGALVPQVADSLTLTDVAFVRGITIPVSAAELITLTEARLVAFGGTLLIAQAESLTLTDFAEAELVAPLSDTVTLSDGGTVNLLEMPHIAETVTLTDTRTVTTSAVGALVPQGADSLTLTDVVLLAGLIPSISATDSLTVTDTATLSAALILTPADSVTLTDTPTITGLTLPIIRAETATLTDTPTLNLIHAPSVADALALSEVLTGAVIHKPQVAESLALTDVLTITGLTLPIPAAELVTLSDTRTVILSVEGVWQIPAADLLSLTDTPTVRGLTLPLSPADSVTLTDTRILNLIHEPHLLDGLTLTDTPTIKGLTLAPRVADTLTLTESSTLKGLTTKIAVADAVSVIPGVPTITRQSADHPPAPGPPRVMTMSVEPLHTLVVATTTRTLVIGVEVTHTLSIGVEATHTLVLATTSLTMTIAVEPMHTLTIAETPTQVLEVRMGEAA